MLVEAADGLRHVGTGQFWMGGNGEVRFLALQARRRIVRESPLLIAFLDALKGQTGGEDGKKSGGQDDLRRAVSQGNETEGQEFLQAKSFLVMRAQIDDQLADHRAA